MTLLCFSFEIDERTGKTLTVNGDEMFAVRCDDRVFVYRNVCPHLGVELNWQEDQYMDMDGVLIQCATHGALFEPETGRCIAGPCHGSYLERVPITMHGDAVHLAETSER